MPDTQIRNAVICGSGPAGYTAGLYLARANMEPLLLAGPLIGGQLTTTTIVENFPGFPEGVDGRKLMMDMEQQCRNYGTEVQYEAATGLRQEDGHLVVETMSGSVATRTLIIATGASAKMMNLPTEQTFWNYGVHTCAVCDGGFYKGKTAAVIGGGDSAMEEATYLTKLLEKVYIVHRRDEFRASKIMAERALENPKIEVVWNHTVEEVLGTVESQHKKKVQALRLKNTVDGSTKEIAVDAMFLAIGHKPNTDWIQGVIDLEDSGYIKVGADQTTNMPGVFAAGDCHDYHYRQAITAAGMGCQAALEAERYLTRIGVS